MPQLSLGGEILQTVDHCKLLGLEIQNNLGWDIQVKNMVSRASRRLFMLYILCKHAAPIEDMLTIFQTYIRPILEYACAVWHPALTKQQSYQLERIQKRTAKIILGNRYVNYESALHDLKLHSLADRRNELVLKFGQQVLNSERHRHMLPTQRSVDYNLRHRNRFSQPRCKTERFQKSTIPFIINQLNNSPDI